MSFILLRTFSYGDQMPHAVSSAKDFFERIVGAGRNNAIAYLHSLYDPSNAAFETDWLDFKGAENMTPDQFKREWSTKEWSIALSGFANTGGGVLVLGIDARPDPVTRVDVACKASLVTNPAAIRSRLTEVYRGATYPPVPGVQIQDFEDPSGTGKGFVVCFIPEGIVKPYRAENATGKPYYIRVGDSFQICPPPLLRQLFFPQVNSRFWVEAFVSHKILPTQHVLVEVGVRVHLSGTATACDTYIVLQSGAYPFTNLRSGTDWTSQSNPQGFCAFEAKRPLHPGTVSQFFDVGVRFRSGVSGGDEPRFSDINTLDFRLLFYAADREPSAVSVSFDRKEIEFGATKKIAAEIGEWHQD
jgi:hypothetical protein